MSIPHSISTLIDKHSTLELESIDRMYLNIYQPKLQIPIGAVSYLKNRKGAQIASTCLFDAITKEFIKQVDRFAIKNNIPLFTFLRGKRKDDVAKEHLSQFQHKEGVLFIGKAQEKTYTFRTEKRISAVTGKTYPWIVKSTAMVNQYYFYLLDEDFGPFFLKYSSYFPYNAKLCINGHEYLKRQLDKEGIAYEALDNGIRSCANPQRMQEIADELSPEKIADLLHKWQTFLPSPFSLEDTQAGYQYSISILQAEFSLTHVFDAPDMGRLYFEEAIRENLDMGRPDQVQLIFDRKVTKATPSQFRTRVVTEGVTPSLHVDYKMSRIKQYHKEGIALRTETTINNTRDFRIGKNILNLPALRKVGFAANRRLLKTERLSHDPAIGEEVFQRAQHPVTQENQRTSAIRFGDLSVQAILQAVSMFVFQVNGFANRDLKVKYAELMGVSANELSQAQMTYQLRRLRLHGLIVRQPKSHRYLLTEAGLRLSQLYIRVYARILRPGLSYLFSPETTMEGEGRDPFLMLQTAMNVCFQSAQLAT